MLDNSAFILSDEELVRYNEWANKIATAMGEAEIESWTLSVKFSFSNFGTGVRAHCESVSDRSGDLVIRDELEGW